MKILWLSNAYIIFTHRNTQTKRRRRRSRDFCLILMYTNLVIFYIFWLMELGASNENQKSSTFNHQNNSNIEKNNNKFLKIAASNENISEFNFYSLFGATYVAEIYP